MNQTQCPHCHNSDMTLIEEVFWGKKLVGYICNVCSKAFKLDGSK